MRFYTKQHQFYCGIDLHARTMYVCILNQAGEMLVHRNMPAGPEPFLKAIAPYREEVPQSRQDERIWTPRRGRSSRGRCSGHRGEYLPLSESLS